jgi:hypothetical protein
MNEKINQILQELYKYDSEFMKHENQLKPILEQLLKNRPDTQFDPAFAESLRKRLLLSAQAMSGKTRNSFWQSLTSLKFALPAVAVVALAVLVGVNYFKPDIYLDNKAQSGKKLQPLAFGSLNEASISTLGKGGMGGGGGSLAPSAASSQDTAISNSKIAAGGMGGGAGIMPVFENYKFIYTGDALTLSDQNVEVLRRQKGFGGNISVTSLLKNFTLPNFNIKAMQSGFVDSINLTEDRDFGYMVNINFRDGSINMNENWFKWQTPERLCQDEACANQYRLKLSDIPSDSEVINIANSFLDQYKIGKANYGEPVVQKQWLKDYELASDKTMAYIPDVVNVVYPLLVNGEKVYDEAGNVTGLNVSVNVRVKKVSGFYDLSNQVYDRSDYAAETSWERIVKIAEAGGNQVFYPMYSEPNLGGEVKTTEVKLGTPTRSLLRQWKNDPGKEGYEIFVPALVFPILDAPANFPAYRSAVTVPLVKELLKDPSSSVPPQIMPLTQPK